MPNLKLPEGRLINGSLFEKDVFKDAKGREGTPSYKVELALEDDDSLAELEDAIVAAAVEKWGPEAEADYENGEIRSPILSGDELADAREQKGKSGDAYRGKAVVRASSIFNQYGDDAPGGVFVCDENAEQVHFDNRGKIYNGSYGIAVVQPSAYDGVGRDGKPGVTLYLQGYQFTRDGEPLRGSVSSMFGPMAAPEGDGKGRRKRK